MDVKASEGKLPTITPAQQGVFFDLIKQQAPSWLLESSAELRGELYKSLKASYQTRRAALDDLKAFKSPESFCKPLLAKAMSDKLGEPFEVEGVVFQHVRSTSSLLGLRKKLVLPIDRDLFTAACENFEESETEASDYHESSLIYVPERITGRSNKILSIQPHEFAKLCRTLDLGKQYQAHVKSLFGDGTEDGSLRAGYVGCARNRFEVARHMAVMQKHISADVYQMLNAVTEGRPTIKLGNNTLGYQRMEIFGVKINGPMFIGPVSEHDDDDYRCVVYIPDDPLHSLKEYQSFDKFEVELSNRLKTLEYRNFFLRFIALKDRGTFLTRLNAKLLRTSNLPLPPHTVYTSISGFDLPADVKTHLFLAMYRQRGAQVLADSRWLVISTDDEDEKSRLARLETYKTIGINIALFLASFVPIVGEVLFAVAGFQLLQGVYEGFDSWSRGEQEQATDYFFDTLENLIVMGALSAGGAAAGKAYKAVRATDFVQGLRTVPVSSGSLRLWKPDLSAYRKPLPIRTGVQFDEQGLVSGHGNRYLPIGTQAYTVRPVPNTDLWEIQSPAASGRYLPVLETNGAGAWRHPTELPQDWNLLTLFRRLGYREAQVSDAQALQILATIGVDEKPLRQLFVDRGKPMAVLVDAVQRFRADNDTARFIEQMRTPASAPFADADLQLYLLTSLAKWPRDAAVSITNIVGKEVVSYGSTKASKKIAINDDLLRKGQFYPTLLAALSNEERRRLLDSATADPTIRATLLTTLIAGQVERMRLQIFDRLVRRSDSLRLELAVPIREAYAELPASVADELVEHADVSEQRELEQGRVPLRLAEEARRYVKVLRLNRAYEGLYLDAASDQGTHLLLLEALENLPGWPKDVSVQIIEWAVHSEQNPGIVAKVAKHKVLIEAYPDRYQLSDAQGEVISSYTGRTCEHLFRCLWEGLPIHSRKSLGVEADKSGDTLRQKITEQALQQRESIARVIGIEPAYKGYRSPMGLADRHVERLNLLKAPDPGVRRSAVLLHRARELYPTHSPAQIERFLLTLGTDEVLALRALESLRQEYVDIRDTLERWIHSDGYYQEDDGPRLKVPRRSKERAAQVILRAWRKETDVPLGAPPVLHSLTFDALPLGTLPVIVGHFSHVGTLEMNGVGGSAGLNTFLRNFTHLQALSLTGNRLTRLPQAVADMVNLTRLDLSENQISLTQEAITQLDSMTQLKTLNLSFNPALGRVPTISLHRALRHLALRGTGITEWPVGTSELPDLQTLDLRDNAISQIPPAVFNARTELNRGTNIDGNPLSSKSLLEITAYQKSHGPNLGVITADYRPAVVTQAALEPRPSSWMSGVPAAQVSRLQALWISLAASPNSGDFFYLLGQLLNTADFERLPAVLSQRVWNVLEAAGEADELRRTLFRMARIGRVGAEDPLRVFSNVEVRVLCYRAMAAALSGNRTLEGELVQLMRGLFRLEQVEEQSLIDIGSRTVAGPFTRRQAQELNLAYRVGLAQRLELPAQPMEMNVRLDVEVSPQQLENTYQAVIAAEASRALLESINTRGFWRDYMLVAHQAEFIAISERTTQSLLRLEAQTHLTRETASGLMKAIMENDKNQNDELFRRLTDEALARHPGLAPSTPSTR